LVIFLIIFWGSLVRWLAGCLFVCLVGVEVVVEGVRLMVMDATRLFACLVELLSVACGRAWEIMWRGSALAWQVGLVSQHSSHDFLPKVVKPSSTAAAPDRRLGIDPEYFS
jgi:hypothetical protein